MTPAGGDTIMVSAKLQKHGYVDVITEILKSPETCDILPLCQF
jgi:hypothetical protein